jgi:hypothetical protein
MKNFAFAFRYSFAKPHKNEKLNNVKSLQHTYNMDSKIYKYLYNLPIILEMLKQQGLS